MVSERDRGYRREREGAREPCLVLGRDGVPEKDGGCRRETEGAGEGRKVTWTDGGCLRRSEGTSE